MFSDVVASASAMDDNSDFNYLQASISGIHKSYEWFMYEILSSFLNVILHIHFMFLQPWMKD